MKHKGIIIAIIVLAAGLRLLGIWHGYPYSYYPDEAHLVKRALAFGSLDFNPHWFHKPAFFMYILFFNYGLYFVIGKLAGLWNSVDAFAVSYIVSPGPFYIIGRFIGVLFSVATVFVVYQIGKVHFKKNVGIIAALILALSFGHIVSCQDIKEDTPTMFFGILSMYFLLNYIDSKKNKDFIWSTIFAGLGAATKVYTIVMLVPIGLGIIIFNWESNKNLGYMIKKTTPLLLSIIVIFYLSYFVVSPYSFIDPLGLKATFYWVIEIKRKVLGFLGHDVTVLPDDFISQRMGYIEGVFSYLKTLFDTQGMGIPISVFAIIGLGILMAKINWKTFIFLSYPLIFIFVSIFLYPGYPETRHQLPVYPFLSITGGVGVVALAGTGGWRKRLVYILFLVSLCHPIYHIVDRGLYISKDDTRNIAKSWIEKNIPAGTKLLIDEEGPQLLLDQTVLKKSLVKAKEADPTGQFTANYDRYIEYQLLAAKNNISYEYTEIRLPWWREKEMEKGTHVLVSEYDKDMGNPLRPVGVESYDYYVDNGFEYAIVHSYKYNRFISDTGRARKFPSFKKFYRELFRRGELIKEFTPSDGERPGPIVKIFKFIP